MGSITRTKCQVFSVGSYLMTGKVFGKGHFARVEEATHRLIGKKVAIKIIDLTCIKEEYARRNLHREPRVMAQLRHPCIAALYETMMHGPRLYVVMEAAGGGDLCALVLRARGAARGLHEHRAKALAAQLVSAVLHMHCRGVVHRDLKMENIMLDSTKQFIKIVDFGLSNVWRAGAALRTPCGSLEYAAPELFQDGRRYGPEVDLWSIGVIVYGMVTGGLPFAGAGGAADDGASRPQLRAAIARGFTRKQRVALACVSTECKTFIEQLLEPKVEMRMKIEEAAMHRWIKRPGMRMKTHPLLKLEPKNNREIYRELSDLCGQPVMEVVAHIKADPFGSIAGMFNIKSHLHQLQSSSGPELLWSASAQEPRPSTPPAYRPTTGPSGTSPTPHAYSPKCEDPTTSRTGAMRTPHVYRPKCEEPCSRASTPLANHLGYASNAITRLRQDDGKPDATKLTIPKMATSLIVNSPTIQQKYIQQKTDLNGSLNDKSSKSPSVPCRPLSLCISNKPVFKVYDNGDCLDPRLPSIDEHSNADATDAKIRRIKQMRRMSLGVPLYLNNHTNRPGEAKRECDLRTREGVPSWRNGVSTATSARVLLQSNSTTTKRASLGYIGSSHCSSNSYCKSDRTISVGCFTTRAMSREPRRTASLK